MQITCVALWYCLINRLYGSREKNKGVYHSSNDENISQLYSLSVMQERQLSVVQEAHSSLPLGIRLSNCPSLCSNMQYVSSLLSLKIYPKMDFANKREWPGNSIMLNICVLLIT